MQKINCFRKFFLKKKKKVKKETFPERRQEVPTGVFIFFFLFCVRWRLKINVLICESKSVRRFKIYRLVVSSYERNTSRQKNLSSSHLIYFLHDNRWILFFSKIFKLRDQKFVLSFQRFIRFMFPNHPTLINQLKNKKKKRTKKFSSQKTLYYTELRNSTIDC